MLGSWIAASLRSATPLLIVMLGETLTQRAGIINLGIEGEMLMGACVGFAVAATTGNPLLGLLAGAIAGAILSGIHSGLVLGAKANQIGSGLAVPAVGRESPARAGLHPGNPGPDYLDRACGPCVGHARGRLALSHPNRTELADRG